MINFSVYLFINKVHTKFGCKGTKKKWNMQIKLILFCHLQFFLSYCSFFWGKSFKTLHVLILVCE